MTDALISRMVKIKNDPITKQDIESFVRDDSDFAFEMRVLNRVRELDFECSHSGTYQDPITGKIRQFDIRAEREDRHNCTLLLAMECKNLRASRPLLLSAVPRTSEESFHDVFWQDSINAFPFIKPVQENRFYRTGQMVSKKTDQVARGDKNGGLVTDDSEAFDKLNQAINSCQALIQKCSTRKGPPHPRRSVVMPVLVVPDGMLWQVDYNSEGYIGTPPRQVPRCSFYINHAWPVDRGPSLPPLNYRISHLEIVTVGNLEEAVSYWTGPIGVFANPY